ncbi:hypothetical protein D9K79_11650 [Acinetobacter cumulans]|uniref:Uncharacterized protein n=1 Tax=Acinetobacter cumulans TaxID=2136182 RepID=A0ABX9U4L7_9GAMM|nr:hypothetical protein [Acinetobacter cumulans]RLL43015.1 hypothetical protein D9K79_11650 [Acinetobacter cumulans]
MKTEIEIIGTALFGKSWMTQIAENLKDQNGQSITRQSVQNWHRHNRVPMWAKEQLKVLAAVRLAEIQALSKTFDDYDFVVDEAIENFLWWNQSKITIESSIYCKLEFTHDEFNNQRHHATITLEKPTDLSDWHVLDFDEKYFMRDMVNIRNELKKKLQRSFAVSK